VPDATEKLLNMTGGTPVVVEKELFLNKNFIYHVTRLLK
jgi:hypothetical protein